MHGAKYVLSRLISTTLKEDATKRLYYSFYSQMRTLGASEDMGEGLICNNLVMSSHYFHSAAALRGCRSL